MKKYYYFSENGEKDIKNRFLLSFIIIVGVIFVEGVIVYTRFQRIEDQITKGKINQIMIMLFTVGLILIVTLYLFLKVGVKRMKGSYILLTDENLERYIGKKPLKHHLSKLKNVRAVRDKDGNIKTLIIIFRFNRI